MCFRIMHIVSKFQIFIHIFTVVNRKSKNRNLKNGELCILLRTQRVGDGYLVVESVGTASQFGQDLETGVVVA